jgi:hypothetical protein
VEYDSHLPQWYRFKDGKWIVRGASVLVPGREITVYGRNSKQVVIRKTSRKTWTQGGVRMCFGFPEQVAS